MMLTRDIETLDGHVRVTVESDQDHVKDPRDEDGNLSDVDVAAWRKGEWEFVTVTVNRLHYCAMCRDFHLATEARSWDTLGMVHFGTGNGWTVTMDQIIETHPVPDMLTELRKEA
jgi:hypothetical protein